MVDYALGLVETKGLVGAIEAADAMVKTADVVLVGKEITRGALVTVKVVGDTAAVRSAVEAGAAAAQRVGKLISKHIIPRPAEGIEDLIYSESSRLQNVVEKLLHGEVAPIEENEERGTEEESKEVEETTVQEELYSMPEGLSQELQDYFKQLDAMTVHELRRFARSIEGLTIYGRQISRANKKELLDELLKAKMKA